ncbi:hypothetical protein ANABIO32_25020 [Rossellomorea marisflavi]|uniref:ABC transporter permease n=1 Tax=Rossellomorea marisflavi TaxID=189381 RepID=UPI0025C8F23E|nr:ABC transporter permease [Rossellomorea marisflavi]GLI84788.1 hypothetical protein ANABIO32_25020 [Rossellomorea marisflavi]
MFNLVRNEWMKIFRRVGTYVMLAILVVSIGVTGAAFKFLDSTAKESADWKKGVQTEIANDKKVLQETPRLNGYMKEEINKNIAINEYRLENGIKPYSKENVWSYVEKNAYLVMFVGLFTIIVSAGIVASEFSWGTIKLLLIRPISRSKILISKYITVLLYGLGQLAILFVISFLLGLILFGGFGESAHLVYIDGNVIEQNMVWYLIKTYLLKTIDVAMMATMAFMISAVFRSSSLAIGISVFLLFTGSNLTDLLAFKFDWAKYSLFANTDLTQYIGFQQPLVKGMTLGFSVTILLIYFLIFQMLAFIFFTKRDVSS